MTLAKQNQPPSGGCVLKRYIEGVSTNIKTQPPSGGCVLKQSVCNRRGKWQFQPPSGGCVLKPLETYSNSGFFDPAAFGRLCVETFQVQDLV